MVGSAVGAVIFTKNKNTTTFFITMSVLIFLALFKISGPESPKCVNNIFPVLENCFLPSK